MLIGHGGTQDKFSPNIVALAQALDRNAKADSSLGAVFAERVRVSCP